MSPVTWTDWPAPRQPTRSVVAGLFIVGSVLWASTLDPWLAIVGGVALVIATSEALLPTRYEITEDGVAVLRWFTRRRQPWSRFRGFSEVPEGFLLLGEGSRAFLRRRRTIVLRCGQAREAVAAALTERWGAACAS